MNANPSDFASAILERDKHRCQYCGHPATQVFRNRELCEHLVPGKAVAACEECFLGASEMYAGVAS